MIRRLVAGLIAAMVLAFAPPSAVVPITQTTGTLQSGTRLNSAFGSEPELKEGDTELSAGTNFTTRTVTLEFGASDAHLSEIADTRSLQIRGHTLVPGPNEPGKAREGSGVAGEVVVQPGPQSGTNGLKLPPVKSLPSDNAKETSAGKPATNGSIVAGKAVLKFSKSEETLTISWWPTGGMLQSTFFLRGASTLWTNVGTANPSVVAVGGRTSFYRVVQ